jgi:hypothetical protein
MHRSLNNVVLKSKTYHLFLDVMKYIVAIFILLLCFGGQVTAQEKDTLLDKIVTPYKSISRPEHSGMQMSPDLLSMPLSMPVSERNLTLPVMNFNPNRGWKTETGTLTGLRSLNGFSFGNSRARLYGRSVWNVFQGIYGIRTYQLNDKLSVGTAGYSDRSFNEYSMKSEIYRQTNYGSSLFVGYKFSDKFSISASFTIQRSGDPFNRNQVIQGGSIFP